MDKETITAIATPLGQSALGIIRISGKKSIEIIDKIFHSKSGLKIKNSKTHTIHYGFIKEQKKIIDEVLVFLMKGDKSYTGETIIEISAHGNPLILKKILTLIISLGARFAEPGEFTKRAFLNGKLNLFQAEAVCDIINAKTETGLDASLKQLQGSGTFEIENIINNLNQVLVCLEAEIDFSEENIEFISKKEIKQKIKNTLKETEKILESYKVCDILKNGLNVVITGAPNTGKSSLLNALVKTSKAIVTDIPGTTRDSLEYMINIKGIPCNIIDTAGLRQTKNIIEKEGIKKTKEHIKQSEIIIFLLDASRKIMEDEKKVFKEIKELDKNKKIIIGLNKIDISKKQYIKEIRKSFNNKNVIIELSAKKLKNIQVLEKEIIKTINNGKIDLSQNYMTNVRHKQLLEKTINHLLSIYNKEIDSNQEIFAFEIREAIINLEEILGRKFAENILDIVFSKFCIGK